MLDMRRLGKQRVEVMQILKALCEGGGWSNHPAVKMWEGCESYLAGYGMAICGEWRDRGYKDTCLEKISIYFDPLSFPKPFWYGDEDFHASHRSNLLRKDPEHYGQFGWTEPHDLEYVWPTKK